MINNEENQKLKDLLVVEEKQTQDYKESLKRVSEMLMKETNSCSNLEIELTGIKDRNEEYKLTISDLQKKLKISQTSIEELNNKK